MKADKNVLLILKGPLTETEILAELKKYYDKEFSLADVVLEYQGQVEYEGYIKADETIVYAAEE